MITAETERCVGCACCQMVCPSEAILVWGCVSVDASLCDDCKGAHVCIKSCPMEALKVTGADHGA